MPLPPNPEGLWTWKSRPFCPAWGHDIVSELGRPTVSQQDRVHVAALGPKAPALMEFGEAFPNTPSLAFHQSF